MLVSPRKNGLTSLFKEVRVFKVDNLRTGQKAFKIAKKCETVHGKIVL